jgi:hypothetical protein
MVDGGSLHQFIIIFQQRRSTSLSSPLLRMLPRAAVSPSDDGVDPGPNSSKAVERGGWWSSNGGGSGNGCCLFDHFLSSNRLIFIKTFLALPTTG